MNSRTALVAVGVVALLVGGLAGYLYGVGSTPRGTTTAAGTTTAPTGSLQLYKVTFNESNTCVGGGARFVNYYQSWWVMLDNITIVQPSNMTLSQVESQASDNSSQAYRAISTMVFTVPDGNYSYYASIGGGALKTGTAGIVVVNGADQVVQVPTQTYCP